MRPRIAASLFAFFLAPSQAFAQGSWGIEANAGTLGYGAGVGLALGQSLNARLFVAGFSRSYDFESSGVDYKARLQLRNAPLLLDWHPGSGLFRFSAGVILNDDKLSVDAQPSAGATYTFNGVTYSAAQVGSATGTIKFNRAAPFVGFGFGRPIARHRGLSFAMDFGAAYLGQPKASLNVSCGAGVPTVTCTQIRNDANAEAAQLSEDIKSYRWYPVLQMHLTYAF
jgi:hypothetical protein